MRLTGSIAVAVAMLLVPDAARGEHPSLLLSTADEPTLRTRIASGVSGAACAAMATSCSYAALDDDWGAPAEDDEGFDRDHVTRERSSTRRAAMPSAIHPRRCRWLPGPFLSGVVDAGIAWHVFRDVGHGIREHLLRDIVHRVGRSDVGPVVVGVRRYLLHAGRAVALLDARQTLAADPRRG